MQKDIYRASRIYYIIEETANYLITLLITGAYLAKLTLSLGFSDSLTALLSSFVNLGCVFQLLAIAIFKRSSVKRKVTIFYTINELLFALLYVTPFIRVGSGIRTALFIIFLLGGYFLLNIASSPKTNWFMVLIPYNRRGTFTAYKEAVSLLTGIAFRFFMGLLIDHFDATENTTASFITCGLVLFVLMIIHTLSLVFSKEKECVESKTTNPSFFKNTKDLIRDKNILSIVILGVLWATCNAFSTPFFGTYQIKELGFSMTYVAVLATVSAITRILASMFLGRYADKNSFAKMLRICFIFVGISFIAVTFTVPANGRIMFLIYEMFMAAAMGGINSAQINLVFDIVSPEKRMNTLSIKYTFSGLFGFCSTLLATPFLTFLQGANISLLGVHIYAQQVLAFISFLLALVLVIYVSKLSSKTINNTKTVGRIKPMHAVGQPPLLGINTEYFKYLKEANIPYSRLHDVGGWFGGNLFVDIPNIFRDFDADECDPASYTFEFTDIVIKGLMENGCEPYFRLGVTIENFYKIKTFRIHPPKDFAKWARICEHIIKHYNEGWANGFHYDIKYWEIWNEPDCIAPGGNQLWTGTKEEFYDLYRVASKHLKSCFGDKIKIGGYGSCGFYWCDENLNPEDLDAAMGITRSKLNPAPKHPDPEIAKFLITRNQYFVDFFEDFIRMVHEENLPLDFFSFHTYSGGANAGGINNNLVRQKFVENKMDEYGLSHVELHLNEWNSNANREQRGESIASATTLAMMCALHRTRMEMMCYYDARIDVSVYGGLFNPLTFEPFCTYYGFKAFGDLYRLGTEIETHSDNENVYVLGATDGKETGILITNIGEDTEIHIDYSKNATAYLIDKEHLYEKTDINLDCFELKKNQTVYIEG